MDLGYLTGTAIFLAALVVLVVIQIAAKKFHPFVYWSTIVASTTAGTTMADFATRSLGIGYTAFVSLAADDDRSKFRDCALSVSALPACALALLRLLRQVSYPLSVSLVPLSSCAVHSRRATRLAMVQSPYWFPGGAVYQIVVRTLEHSLNIHAKPEAVLHVGRSSEEHCPESQASLPD